MIASAKRNTGKKGSNYRWTICVLLFFATTVNYLDRQVLSLLQPTLAERYQWTNTDYANITSVFQFVYAIAMLFAGRTVDKLGTKKGYAWAIIIWSAGAMLHALAIPIGEKMIALLGWIGITSLSVSVAGFAAARFILAIGEAGNFPAAIKATAEYFPKQERSLATGIFNSGANIGAVLAPLTVPWIEVAFGWQAAFIAIGAIGLLWLIEWQWLYEKPERQKRLSSSELAYINYSAEEDVTKENTPRSAPEVAISGKEPKERFSWKALLQYRQTWVFIIGKFMTDGVWWFFLFWLPAYLKAQYGMEKTELTLPLSILYTITMFGSIGGWLPTLFMKRYAFAYDARLKAMLMIAFVPLVVLAVPPLESAGYWVPVILIGVGTAAHQAWSANMYTIVSDLFPKKAIASVIGIGGMAGAFSGVIVSKTGGALFDHYQELGHIQTGYTIMFSFCAVAYLFAWMIMKVLVPKYQPAGMYRVK